MFGLSPFNFVAVLSFMISLGFVLAHKFFSDQATMRELKKDIKKYQKQMKESREHPERVKELTKKSMQANLKYMKASMRPMFITIIPIFVIFGWLRNSLSGLIIIPLSFWPGHLGWLGTYIIFSLVFTMIFRKALKVV